MYMKRNEEYKISKNCESKNKKTKIRLKCRHEQFSLSFYLFFSFLLFNHISCLSALNLIISLMREKQVLDTLEANIHSLSLIHI